MEPTKAIDEIVERTRLAGDLAWSGKLDEAMSLANLLVSEHPSDPRSWTCRSAVLARRGDIDGAVGDATKAVQCDPSDRGPYSWLCLLLVKQGDFGSCLEYSNKGLAATGGWSSTKAMYEENLTFLGARALFELQRYDEALKWLKEVSPKFGLGRDGVDLMTKESVNKACKTAVGKQRAATRRA